MTDTKRLTRIIEKSNFAPEDLAGNINISVRLLKKKIHNQAEFKAREILALISLLDIEDAQEIFFTNFVDK